MLYEFINDKKEYDSYLTTKEVLINLLDILSKDKKEAIYYTQSKVSASLKTKEEARYFLDMLSQFLEDLLTLKNKGDIILKSQEEILVNLLNVINNPSEILLEVLKLRGQLNLNVNIPLLLDHLIFFITKG